MHPNRKMTLYILTKTNRRLKMRIKRSIPVSALCILLALSLTSCISVRKVSDEEIRAGFDELCDDIF